MNLQTILWPWGKISTVEMDNPIQDIKFLTQEVAALTDAELLICQVVLYQKASWKRLIGSGEAQREAEISKEVADKYLTLIEAEIERRGEI